jgi:hypothetical protein
MVKDVEELLEHADTVVIGTNDPEFRTVAGSLRKDQNVVDFVRLVDGGGRRQWVRRDLLTLRPEGKKT